MDNYFDYLSKLAFGRSVRARMDKYSSVIRYLFEKGYTYRIPMDQNRFSDGVGMRWKYYKETGQPDPINNDNFCSMLEMMVALARRCEIDIMSNDSYGDRTREWFWEMLCSMGLDAQTNDIFSRSACDEIVDRFLDGQYAYDGKGGLFSFMRPRFNIRDTDIWTQLNWFLAEKGR